MEIVESTIPIVAATAGPDRCLFACCRAGDRGGGRGGFGGRSFGGGRGGGGHGYDQGPPSEVVEAGEFQHPCEGEAVCKLSNTMVSGQDGRTALRRGGRCVRVQPHTSPCHSAVPHRGKICRPSAIRLDTLCPPGLASPRLNPPAPAPAAPPQIPYFNAPMYLENKTQVGKIEEIFGPINAVYFTIKMSDGVVATSYAKGDKFFIDPAKLLPLDRFLPKPKGEGGRGGRGGRGGGRGGFGGRGGGRGFGAPRGGGFGGRGGGFGGRGGGGFGGRGGGGFAPRGGGGGFRGGGGGFRGGRGRY
jgi:H/ACA ribonucleoprotein complex subunit 1